MADEGRATDSLKSATAAAVRALARVRALEVSFSAAEMPDRMSRADVHGTRLPVPELVPSAENLAALRGAADFRALFVRHHDPAAHRRILSTYAQGNPLGKAALDTLEQVRCAALGGREMAGVAANVGALLDRKCVRIGYDRAQEFSDDSLADALGILAWAQVLGTAPPRGAENLLARWRPAIDAALSSGDLAALGQSLADQKAYARAARRVLSQLGILSAEGGDGESDGQQDASPDGGNPGEGEDGEAKSETSRRKSEEGEGEDSSDSQDDLEGAQSGQDADDGQAVQDGALSEGDSPGGPLFRRLDEEGAGQGAAYRVYTTRFDEIVRAEDLSDSMELARLRGQLDSLVAAWAGTVTRLANRLQRKLMARQTRSWRFDQEEGTLDAARLARIVANPTVPLTYKQEKETEFRDTVVTLLIDNSGSMRGRPIAFAAMTTDILARTLERCGVKVEILGFTTKAWKGGKSREAWLAGGRPENPGRLNDLRHIIYKAADSPWRRTHKNLGLMLKEGILKENIDGEALVWAWNRLARRPEKRKILMVISDGAPVDDSTLASNAGNILERDLHNVIEWIEARRDVELTAIGIGHDVGRYYRKAMTIADAGELGRALTARLEELFSENLVRRRHRQGSASV